MPGCTRSSVFTKKAQLLAGAPDVEPTAPESMCGPCDGVFKKLKNRQVSCGINGCKHKWTWTADEQIQAYATGKPNEPPRRMCDECKTVFGAIADREVRCRTSGCKKTWTWSRGDQLDACLAGKPVPKAAARMCQSCLDIYSKLKDVERPCRRTTCKRTWTDKRGAQLARAVRGKTGDPYPHYCAECEKELGELEDRQVPCKTDHCTGTWTWTSAQQLAAGVRPVVKDDEKPEAPEAPAEARRERRNRDGRRRRGRGCCRSDRARRARGWRRGTCQRRAGSGGTRPGQGQGKGRKGRGRNRKRRREPRPPERRCEACIEFLKDRKTHEIPCSRCATAIYWPPESQLQTHLGNWAEPSLCGACKRDATEAARAAQREALRHPTAAGRAARPRWLRQPPSHPNGSSDSTLPSEAPTPRTVRRAGTGLRNRPRCDRCRVQPHSGTTILA